MKKIRIKICNFDIKKSEKTQFGFFLLKILKKYYDVELSENPEYVFYHDSSFEHLKYDAVKIFYTGENVSPNFNLCDYAISFDNMNFEDRSFRLPIYLVATFYNQSEIEMAKEFDMSHPPVFSRHDLAQKTEFCSFVYSNYLAEDTRKKIFDVLSRYKRVNAGGKYLNNVGQNVVNKFIFESKHKFSVAFENSSRIGYTTEKLVTALAAGTIPIYWGNPAIGREFNTKRFINCHEYDSFEKVLERVKEIDADDELYIRIINEPILAEGYIIQKVYDDFELFLRHIFDQPFESAKRNTINPMHAIKFYNYERILEKYTNRKYRIQKIFTWCYKPLKKVTFLQTIKVKYLKKRL